MTQASNEMCISPYQLRQLLDAGLIPVVQRPDKLNRDWIIDKRASRALVSALLNSARKSLTEGGVSLSGIQKKGYSIVQLVEGMSDGSIRFRAKLDKNRTSSFKQFVEFEV